MFQSVPIPAAQASRFVGSIAHPDLWLWDAWTCQAGDTLHSYCLALPRQFEQLAINPQDRNAFTFHIRHFESSDYGLSWFDHGAFLAPPSGSNRNIWSGSIMPRETEVLTAYTETCWTEPNRPFVQSICVGAGQSFNEYDGPGFSTISDPERDYDEIINAGYYLSDPASLGSVDGEADGPILSWRDPFLFEEAGQVSVFWSAKVGPSTPAIAHAILDLKPNDEFTCQLKPPITLPDADAFTQAELPKVWRDHNLSCYCLLVSTCDRTHERQPDAQVTKSMRLYRSLNLAGPWTPWSDQTSVVPMPEFTYGASPYLWHNDRHKITFIAPISEQAPLANQLTINTGVTLRLDEL